MAHTPFKNYFYAAGLVNLLTAVCILLAQSKLPPEVPLFYGLPQGQAQLTKSIFLLIPTIISFSISLVNIFLMTLLKNDFLKKVLICASLTIAIFTSVTSFKIIFLVGDL
jgi:hypothetical protein